MKNLPKYIDIAFCLVVLPVMVLMFPVERWYHNFQSYMVSLGVWLYSLYFINRFFTVPWLFKGLRQRTGGIVLILLSLGVTYVFSAITLYTPPPNRFDEGIVRIFPAVKQYQQAVWSLFMIVEAFSFAVGLLIQMEIQRERRREVEWQRDKAEIDLYRAQIKPHFMFNTLNSLYGLFLTHSPNALPSLERYIQMVRYIHVSACRPLVSLGEEVEYIREFVELQSLRLNGRTGVDLLTDIADPEVEVPPMLMLTFVENCFKYGVSPVEESRIEIIIKESGGELELRTRNRIFPSIKSGGRMGIENCRKRLELGYGDAYTLLTSKQDNEFKVELKIRLIK